MNPRPSAKFGGATKNQAVNVNSREQYSERGQIHVRLGCVRQYGFAGDERRHEKNHRQKRVAAKDVADRESIIAESGPPRTRSRLRVTP